MCSRRDAFAIVRSRAPVADVSPSAVGTMRESRAEGRKSLVQLFKAEALLVNFALMLIREHVALAPFTTLGVGGPARYFAEATSEAEVIEGVEFARSRQLPLFVLGGGSNLLVADAGFSGLVLKVAIGGVSSFATPQESVLFIAGAGVDWDSLVAQSVDANCAGLECLSGIPGTVGGTPVQNVGAYGQEVSETIREVRALDLQSLQVRIFSNAECGFSYRSSIFNTTERDCYIILQVSFALRQGGKPSIRYADLQKFFAESCRRSDSGGSASSGARNPPFQSHAHRLRR